MPHGRPWRLGRGACPHRIDRFLEPCLLLLLHGDQSHGYNLLEELNKFGFAEAPVDSSVVYRALRQMEEAGWLISRWDTSGPGPAKRLYTVTPAGEEWLHAWAKSICQSIVTMERFLSEYEASFRKTGSRESNNGQ